MSDLAAHTVRRQLPRAQGGGGVAADVSALVLSLDGIIDASTYARLERALEAAITEEPRYLVVDFSRVEYINSTGISALIRYFERYRAGGGILCLTSVSDAAGSSMRLLGVESLIPFTKDLSEALAFVRDFRVGKAIPPRPGSVPRPSPPVAVRPEPSPAVPGRVLVVSAAENRFTRILARRFDSSGDALVTAADGRYVLRRDALGALGEFDTLRPDIVVIDDECDPRGEFVSRLKMHRDRSLTSIIKIYRAGTDVKGGVEFKIWENDYLVDPFPLSRFFALSEAELSRVMKDRSVFRQQVHFEFRSRPDHLEKAQKLSQHILEAAFSHGDAVTTFAAAVKEGLDNARMHGNLSISDRMIDVNFLVDRKKVTVIIQDEGSGFDYEYYLGRVRGKDAFEDARKRILEEGIRGGLGILLMSRCSDRLAYSGSGNVLRLEKNI